MGDKKNKRTWEKVSGFKLAQLRQEAHHTQKSLAAIIPMSINNLSKIEGVEEANMQKGKFDGLADALGMSQDALRAKIGVPNGSAGLGLLHLPRNILQIIERLAEKNGESVPEFMGNLISSLASGAVRRVEDARPAGGSGTPQQLPKPYPRVKRSGRSEKSRRS